MSYFQIFPIQVTQIWGPWRSTQAELRDLPPLESLIQQATMLPSLLRLWSGTSFQSHQDTCAGSPEGKADLKTCDIGSLQSPTSVDAPSTEMGLQHSFNASNSSLRFSRPCSLGRSSPHSGTPPACYLCARRKKLPMAQAELNADTAVRKPAGPAAAMVRNVQQAKRS